MRKTTSLILKLLVVICSFTGIVLGCFLFEKDGYSAWYKRLYYFTNLSNAWIGVTMVFALFVCYAKTAKSKRTAKVVYVCKFVFTVSISITGIIFCGLLAPFADEGYNPWSINSVLVHVLVPIFSIVDFFVDDFSLEIKNPHLFFALIPPFAYFVFALVMGACGVDFGKGDTFPYFFMNFNSPVGLFGFSVAPPRPAMGSVYWIILFLFLVLGIAKAFASLSPTNMANRKNSKQQRTK